MLITKYPSDAILSLIEEYHENVAGCFVMIDAHKTSGKHAMTNIACFPDGSSAEFAWTGNGFINTYNAVQLEDANLGEWGSWQGAAERVFKRVVEAQRKFLEAARSLQATNLHHSPIWQAAALQRVRCHQAYNRFQHLVGRLVEDMSASELRLLTKATVFLEDRGGLLQLTQHGKMCLEAVLAHNKSDLLEWWRRYKHLTPDL